MQLIIAAAIIVISFPCQSMTQDVVIIPDYLGRDKKACCNESISCKSLLQSQCSIQGCDCPVYPIDFRVRGMKQAAVGSLGSAMGIGRSGNLIAVGGSGGGWFARLSPLSSFIYEQSEKTILTTFSDSSGAISAAAADSLACLAFESKVKCRILVSSLDASGTKWRSVDNPNLPTTWLETDFLMNQNLFEQAECMSACEYCFSSTYGKMVEGAGARCFGQGLSVSGTTVAVTGRWVAMYWANKKPKFCGFFRLHFVEKDSGSERYRWSSAFFEHKDQDESFGAALVHDQHVLVVGAPTGMDEDVYVADGIDNPGAVKVFNVHTCIQSQGDG
eukprot:765025-Hanusia_phi.AAC.2